MRRCDTNFELDCQPDRFWLLYLDEDFTRELFVRGLGWDAPTFTEFRSNEREVIRNLSAAPKLDLDGKVAKLIGEQMGYREWGRFDRAKGEWEFRHQTNIFGERLKMQGRMWAEPLGQTRMRWRTQTTIECSIIGVGGLLERTAEQNINKTYPISAKYWNRWLAEHPAAE
jgi:hypothetical protein